MIRSLIATKVVSSENKVLLKCKQSTTYKINKASKILKGCNTIELLKWSQFITHTAFL
jgi:hypothetical protein